MSDLKEQLETLLSDFVASATGQSREDVERYGKAIANDFERFLVRAYYDGEESARAELTLLRGQLKVLAAKELHHVTAEAVDFVKKALEILAEVAMVALTKLAR